jgi:hypothetical protein
MEPSFSEKLLQLQARVQQGFREFNAKRKPRYNALLIAGVILLGGFMTYNFIGKQLTQVANKSTRVVATPKPTQIVSPTPSQFPSITPTIGVTE